MQTPIKPTSHTVKTPGAPSKRKRVFSSETSETGEARVLTFDETPEVPKTPVKSPRRQTVPNAPARKRRGRLEECRKSSIPAYVLEPAIVDKDGFTKIHEAKLKDLESLLQIVIKFANHWSKEYPDIAGTVVLPHASVFEIPMTFRELVIMHANLSDACMIAHRKNSPDIAKPIVKLLEFSFHAGTYLRDQIVNERFELALHREIFKFVDIDGEPINHYAPDFGACSRGLGGSRPDSSSWKHSPRIHRKDKRTDKGSEKERRVFLKDALDY